MANRRMLLKAIETVQAGGRPPGVADASQIAAMTGPTRSTELRRRAPGRPGGASRRGASATARR